MQQIKIFRALEFEAESLEKRVNQWLEQSSAKIVNIFGNMAPQSASATGGDSVLGQGAHDPSDIFLVIVYEKS